MVDLSPRAARFLLGLVISAIAYGFTVRSGLGLGPLFMVQTGVEAHVGVTPGVAALLVGVGFFLLSLLVGGGAGVGTFVGPVVLGVLIDLTLPHLPEVRGVVLSTAVFVVATFVLQFGAALIFRSGLGAHGLDGTMNGLARRSGLPTGRVRLGLEAAMLLVGLLLGSAVTVGTVIMAAMVGHSMQFCLAMLERYDRPLTRSVEPDLGEDRVLATQNG